MGYMGIPPVFYDRERVSPEEPKAGRGGKVRGQHRHVHQARAGATHTNAPVLSARILLDEMCTVCDVCSSNSSSTLNLDVWRPLSANTTST
jgi:hypothetical protein